MPVMTVDRRGDLWSYAPVGSSGQEVGFIDSLVSAVSSVAQTVSSIKAAKKKTAAPAAAPVAAPAAVAMPSRKGTDDKTLLYVGGAGLLIVALALATR